MDPQTVKEVARWLGKQPKARRFEHVCLACGKPFTATARAKFCSRRCSWTYHNTIRAKAASVASEALPVAEGEDLAGQAR